MADAAMSVQQEWMMAAGRREETLTQDQNREVWGAIGAFEQILQVMPNDMASLESLWRAYSDLDMEEKAVEYVLRLGEVLQEQYDAVTAARVLTAVRGAQYTDSRIEGLLKILAEIAGEEELASMEASREKAAAAALRCTVNVADELSFAWNLLECGILNQEEYAAVAQDVVEMSSTSEKGTVSLLHALASRSYAKMDRLMAYVASEQSVPMIQLALFEVPLEAARMLPMPYMRGRGVIVFETVGRTDALIVLLNPYDEELRKELEEAIGRRCHYFLTRPSDFDKALDDISERLRGRGE